MQPVIITETETETLRLFCTVEFSSSKFYSYWHSIMLGCILTFLFFTKSEPFQRNVNCNFQFLADTDVIFASRRRRFCRHITATVSAANTCRARHSRIFCLWPVHPYMITNRPLVLRIISENQWHKVRMIYEIQTSLCNHTQKFAVTWNLRYTDWWDLSNVLCEQNTWKLNLWF